jgi:hypothetical protein
MGGPRDQREVEIPTSWWERLAADKRRLAIVAAAVVALLILGGIALAARAPSELAQTGPASGDRDTSAQGSTAPTTTGDGTGAPSAEDPGSSSGTPASGEDAPDGASDGVSPDESDPADPLAYTRSPAIAYRKDGALWVCGEDGTGARRVQVAAAGVFALSPDAGTLAWVDPATRILSVTEVDSLDVREIGACENLPLVWAADSLSLAFVAGGASGVEVRRYDAAGEGAVLPVAAGHSPAVSADGETIALVSSAAPGQPGPILVAGPGDAAAKPLPITAATRVAWGGDGLVYAQAGDAPGEDRVMTCATDGTAPRLLAVPDPGDRLASIGSLEVSPDGQWILLAAKGDDGYSRTSAIKFADGHQTSFSQRRDTYPLSWSADGARVFIVEGNAWQGQPTTVVSFVPDGTARIEVVPGGGL